MAERSVEEDGVQEAAENLCDLMGLDVELGEVNYLAVAHVGGEGMSRTVGIAARAGCRGSPQANEVQVTIV